MLLKTNTRRSALPWLVGAVLLAGASPAAAKRHHHECLAPTGGDDTGAIQKALDRCSGSKKHGCTVRLCEGTFDTGILRVRDFRGTLQGAGRRETVLRALPDLQVSENIHDFFRDDPFLPDQAWPYLVQFIEGSGRVEDLGILVPVPPPGSMPTTGWHLLDSEDAFEQLRGAILFTGRKEVDFEVREVRVEAEDPGNDLGTTVFNGVEFGGLLFDPDDTSEFPVFPARGRFRIEDSTFDGVLAGTPLTELAAARVIVAGNRYRSTIAVDVTDVDRSRIAILKNRWVVSTFGVLVRQNVDGAPSRETRLLVGANRGRVEPLFPDFGAALWFEDPSPPGSATEPGATDLRVWRNSWTLAEGAGPAASGITASGAGRLWIAANRLAGQAGTGIEVDATAGCRVLHNSMHGLDTGDGPDLHLGPATSDCLAIVDDDVVVDEGAANRVIRR